MARLSSRSPAGEGDKSTFFCHAGSQLLKYVCWRDSRDSGQGDERIGLTGIHDEYRTIVCTRRGTECPDIDSREDRPYRSNTPPSARDVEMRDKEEAPP